MQETYVQTDVNMPVSKRVYILGIRSRCLLEMVLESDVKYFPLLLLFPFVAWSFFPLSSEYEYSSVLFLSLPPSEGWPHHGRTFSIYLYPLSF